MAFIGGSVPPTSNALIKDLLANNPNLAASLCLEHTFFLEPSLRVFSISLRILLASFDLE